MTRSNIAAVLAILGAVCAVLLLMEVRSPEVVIATGLLCLSVALLVLAT